MCVCVCVCVCAYVGGLLIHAILCRHALLCVVTLSSLMMTHGRPKHTGGDKLGFYA